MEGEEFDIVGKSDDTNTKLDEGMDQKHKLILMLSSGQDPDLHAVQELPGIDVLDSIFSLKMIITYENTYQVVSDISEMEAHLSNIEETELIASGKVMSEKLSEGILGNTDS